MSAPIVLICCNYVKMNDFYIHSVKDQYIPPLTGICGAIPLLIPAIKGIFDLEKLGFRPDGVLLTGAPAHVSPAHYGAVRDFGDDELDEARDHTVLPLIKSAIKMDIPMITICRGLQEMNVACGGTLHQHVRKLPGKLDHRETEDRPNDERYLVHRHSIKTAKGGIFEKLGLPPEFKVNSLHQQGIDRLGADLHIEGHAEDGLVEAISHTKTKFTLGVQWHPEGDIAISPVSVKIFEAFGRALRGTF